MKTLERVKPENMLRKDNKGEFTALLNRESASMFPVKNKSQSEKSHPIQLKHSNGAPKLDLHTL